MLVPPHQTRLFRVMLVRKPIRRLLEVCLHFSLLEGILLNYNEMIAGAGNTPESYI
jgi:hypothetical protein